MEWRLEWICGFTIRKIVCERWKYRWTEVLRQRWIQRQRWNREIMAKKWVGETDFFVLTKTPVVRLILGPLLVCLINYLLHHPSCALVGPDDPLWWATLSSTPLFRLRLNDKTFMAYVWLQTVVSLVSCSIHVHALWQGDWPHWTNIN